MDSVNFIEKLNELASNEDVIAVAGDIAELRSKFEDYVLEEERKFQVSQLEAQENSQPIPELDTDFGKEEFYTIYSAYQERKKAAISEKKAVEDKNLSQKKALIGRLNDVILNEENIGAAFAAFKEIQESWKEIGDIPRNLRNEIQTQYSKLIEDFFYNISIYKELKDHDLKRNHQLKLDVITRLKELSKESLVKNVENQLRILQNDWEDIGPVLNEDWEKLKDAYWTEVRSVYDRINRYYEDRKKELSNRIEQKRALIEETKAIVEEVKDCDSVKTWNKKTDQIQKIQEQWKTIGFGSRKENDQVWTEFRAVCDEFFGMKKEFFSSVHKDYDSIAEKKKGLIDKALELKQSDDWKRTANELKRLQQEWKKLGHAGLKHEQKLWKAFRAACDDFFNSRNAHFEEKDKEFESNLKLKEALIEELINYKINDDVQQTIEDLKNFASRFNEIGMVPLKQKDSIFSAFKKALDAHYASLKIEGQEKESIMFQAKLDTMAASPNASALYRNAKNDLRKEIDREMKEINLLENNLGFFANSKGAESLKKDVEKKINISRNKIDKLKRQLKMIPNE